MKFIMTAIEGENVTTKEFDSEYLYDIIERTEEFLRGCGFYFYGQLDIVDDSRDDAQNVKLGDSFTVSFNSPIYESPDGGKTVYTRQAGTTERTLHSKE